MKRDREWREGIGRGGEGQGESGRARVSWEGTASSGEGQVEVGTDSARWGGPGAMGRIRERWGETGGGGKRQ